MVQGFLLASCLKVIGAPLTFGSTKCTAFSSLRGCLWQTHQIFTEVRVVSITICDLDGSFWLPMPFAEMCWIQLEIQNPKWQPSDWLRFTILSQKNGLRFFFLSGHSASASVRSWRFELAGSNPARWTPRESKIELKRGASWAPWQSPRALPRPGADPRNSRKKIVVFHAMKRGYFCRMRAATTNIIYIYIYS